MRYGIAFGKFDPLTRQHEKLLDRLKNHVSGKSMVFVMGITSPSPIEDRIHDIQRFYPELTVINIKQVGVGIPACLKYFESNIEDATGATIYCGSGYQGVSSISKAGGSDKEMHRIIARYQSRFGPEGYRVEGQERGVVSASMVRALLKGISPNINLDNVKALEVVKSFMHSKFEFSDVVRYQNYYLSQS